MATQKAEFEIEETTKASLAVTPLPRGKCWALYLANLTDNFCFTFLFPFLPYLVEFLMQDFLEGIDKEQHDRYVSIFSGILGSCYSAAQCLSSFVVCVSLSGYICDKYGKRPVLIFGSICNALGALAFAFVGTYPMAIIVRVFAGFCNTNAVASRSLLADFTDKTNRTEAFTYLNIFAIIGSILGPFLGGMLAEPNKRYPGLFGDNQFFERFPFSLPCFATLAMSLVGVYLVVFYVFDEVRKPKSSESSLLETESPRQFSFWETISELRGNTAYITACLAWCVTSITLIMSTELTALWSKSALDHGGLGWKEEYKLGILYAWSSFILLCFLVLFLRKLIARFGNTTMLKAAQLIAVPVVANFPTSHYLYDTPFLWPCLMTICGIWGICMGILLTTIQIAINSVVPQDLLGSANGIAISVVAFIRAIGPLTAGLLFGWSLNSGLGFPFNCYFAYFLESTMLGVSFFAVRYGFKQSSSAK